LRNHLNSRGEYRILQFSVIVDLFVAAEKYCLINEWQTTNYRPQGKAQIKMFNSKKQQLLET